MLNNIANEMWIVVLKNVKSKWSKKYKILAKSRNLSVAKICARQNREINMSRKFHVIRYTIQAGAFHTFLFSAACVGVSFLLLLNFQGMRTSFRHFNFEEN